MRKFINDLVDKIGTYPIREPFKELKNYDDVTKTKVWSTLPILNFLSDNWMLPVIQSRGYIEQFTVFEKPHLRDNFQNTANLNRIYRLDL